MRTPEALWRLPTFRARNLGKKKNRKKRGEKKKNWTNVKNEVRDVRKSGGAFVTVRDTRSHTNEVGKQGGESQREGPERKK